METKKSSWEIFNNISAEDFIMKAISYGNPIETSLVGAFDPEGKGSRRDMELPLHRDGDYTTEFKNKIDYVCLYCVNPGDAVTIIKDEYDVIHRINLKKNEGIIIDNKLCLHAREGLVRDRVLLRIWIKKI